MGLKRGNIYNLCKDSNNKFFIKEYIGWLDLNNHVGYYKLPNKRWTMTDLDTGNKYGDNSWPTRKEAIEVFENGKWYIQEYKQNNLEKIIEKQKLFQETLQDYLKSKIVSPNNTKVFEN